MLCVLILIATVCARDPETPHETIAEASTPIAIGTVRVDGEDLFTMEHYERNGKGGGRRVERRYLDGRKNIAYRELATFVQGRQRTQHSFDRQGDEEGRLHIDAGVVEYWLRRSDGSTRTKRSEVDGPAVGSTGLVPFIVRDDTWQQLLTGARIRLRYLSWSKQKSYRFVLETESPSPPFEGQETITVVMRPSAWVVRQLFDEIRYRFRRSDRRLLEYRGRLSVRKRAGGRYEDINDAWVSFSYPRN